MIKKLYYLDQVVYFVTTFDQNFRQDSGALMWKKYLVTLGLGLIFSATTFADDVILKSPLIDLTPGVLCQHADSYRYPEHVAYCERDVDNVVKWKVIELYMEKMPGLKINGQNRSQYKIDHFIPLCMGGANDIQNLWPQHMSVFKVTDIVELDLCKKLESAEITQAQAVSQMKYAKGHLEDIKKIQNPEELMKYIDENYNK